MPPSSVVDASYDVVVPTIGRPSLRRLLRSLAAADGPSPGRVLLVDDRGVRRGPLLDPSTAVGSTPWIEVIRGRAAGPAAARNDGWRASTAEWVAFLDDDVEVPAGWCRRLVEDLGALGADVAASQGRLHVPLPADRRPTDWERNVAGLESARWATADMAYRRRVLAAVGGFDERFRRAYREDADLGLRVTDAGWRIERGARQVIHPVRPAPWWISVRAQRGNADDALMDRIHGTGWRDRAQAPAGRRRTHLATTAALAVGLVGAASRRRSIALVGSTVGAALVGDLAWRRIAPGPRTMAEVAGVVATSLALPPVATIQWLRGLARARRLAPPPRPRPLDAVLFDRDGTLIHDVPYNRDPDAVVPVAGVRQALDRLRTGGVAVGIVTNQSGVGRGLLRPDEVHAVTRRVEQMLGPFAVVAWCPHAPDEGCRCRKPGPELIERAAVALGTDPRRCAVVGDIGADIEAAAAAGARGILVPTDATRVEEVESAPEVVADLGTAVDRLLTGAAR